MVRVRSPRFSGLALLTVLSTVASAPVRAFDEGFGGAALDDEHLQVPMAKDRDHTDPAGEGEWRADESGTATTEARSTGLSRVETPFARALDGARASQKQTPLVRLRWAVRTFDDDATRAEAALRAGISDADARDAARALYASRKAVLDDVEVMGLRLRERCMRARGESAKLPALLPRGIRVSRDTEAIGLLLGFADPEGCDRQVLVDDNVIARIERLHEIERIAPELGYHRLAERRALESERDAILDDLMGRTDDRPAKLQFTSKRHDGKATMERLRPQGTLLEKRGEGSGPVTPIR